MKTYIVKDGKELKIIKVQPHQEDFFQADYAGRILLSADSIHEAVITFDELSRQPAAPAEKSPD